MSGEGRDFRLTTRRQLEGYLHDCLNNGFKGQAAYRELARDFADIVPGLAEDCAVIDDYYREVKGTIEQCLCDIQWVFLRVYECEERFVIALNREIAKVEHLLAAQRALNALLDPRPVARLGGVSLIEGSPEEFRRLAGDVDAALAAKLFEMMVKRDINENIVGYDWDLIGSILDREYTDISEVQFAALARVFIGMDSLSDKERFLNALADVVDLRNVLPEGAVVGGIGGGIPGAEDMLAFIFCPDKIAGLQRHIGIALASEDSPAAQRNIIQRYELLNGVMFAKSGDVIPALWGDSSGPISLQEGTLTFGEGSDQININGIKINVITGIAMPDFQTMGVTGISLGGREVMVSNVHRNEYIASAVSNLAIDGARIRYQVNPFAAGLYDAVVFATGFIKGTTGDVVSGLKKGADGTKIAGGLLGATAAQAEQNQQRVIDTLEARNTASFMERANFYTVTISCSQGDLMISGRPSPETENSVDDVNRFLRGNETDRDELLNNPQIPLDTYLRRDGISR